MTDPEVYRNCGECATIDLKSMMVFDNKTNDWKCEICDREKEVACKVVREFKEKVQRAGAPLTFTIEPGSTYISDPSPNKIEELLWSYEK